MALVTEGERCGIMVEEEKVTAREAVNEDSEGGTGTDGGGVNGWYVCGSVWWDVTAIYITTLKHILPDGST